MHILITMAKAAAAAAILFFLFSTTGPFQGKTFFFSVSWAPFRATIIKSRVIRYKIIIFYCS